LFSWSPKGYVTDTSLLCYHHELHTNNAILCFYKDKQKDIVLKKTSQFTIRNVRIGYF